MDFLVILADLFAQFINAVIGAFLGVVFPGLTLGM